MTKNEKLMTYSGHLEVLRRMLFRILGITFVFSCIIFCFKTPTFDLLLSPTDSSFTTYHWLENFVYRFNPEFRFEPFEIELIATDLSSQFISHLTTSIYLGLLCASPMILYELFRFVSPALLENERRYSTKIVASIYTLFIMGVLMSYYILFPLTLRFLGTYNVADKVHTMITLDSYITTFASFTLLLGIVFQLPVIAFILAKMNVLSASKMKKYRKHAIVVLAIVSAVITPPDIITLIIVCIPLYGLYEISIGVIKVVEVRSNRSK